jgi:uncharacterized membrane protein YjfL (UPF0719 family)
MSDLLDAALHAVVYAVVGGALVVLALYVLDLLTPGHLGTHLRGSGSTASGSAGLVAAAWLIGTGAIVFTAIWTNGETSLGSALLWTVVFGLLGILVNTLMLVAVDVVTPGRLGDIVTTPGDAVPLAYVTAAAAIAVSAVVCASIA